MPQEQETQSWPVLEPAAEPWLPQEPGNPDAP
jgi:hypothetical protein